MMTANFKVLFNIIEHLTWKYSIQLRKQNFEERKVFLVKLTKIYC